MGKPISSVSCHGAGGGFHIGQCGGSHLSARHAIDGVIDEEHRHLFATICSVRSLPFLLRRVSITLIGKDMHVGRRASCLWQPRSSAVCNLSHIKVKNLYAKTEQPAGNACHEIDQTLFVNRFRDEPVGNAVHATGAISKGTSLRDSGLYAIFSTFYSLKHSSSFSLISAGVKHDSTHFAPELHRHFARRRSDVV